ncbi:hypothetical protein [Acidiluteibacter ferrifornacis]|nr:hypothetical protein [Acidiluteibacter ferrifornacis]
MKTTIYPFVRAHRRDENDNKRLINVFVVDFKAIDIFTELNN